MHIRIHTTKTQQSLISRPFKFFRVNFDRNFCCTCNSVECCMAEPNIEISNEWFRATLYTSKKMYLALDTSKRTTMASLMGRISMELSRYSACN